MTPRHIRIIALSVFAVFLAAAGGGAQTAEPGETAPETRPERVIGVPEDLEAILLVNEEIKKIDKPYTVTVILNNPTKWPIKCEESFDFIAGFDAKKINVKKGDDGKMVVTRTALQGFVREERRTEPLSKPLVIAPGAFVGRDIDLSNYFPALRTPGRYEMTWSDPVIGKSNEVIFSVVEYVSLATNYGNILLRLLPEISPKTAAEFKRLVRERRYDESVVVGADGNRITFATLARGKAFPQEDKNPMSFSPRLRARSVALVGNGPGFFIQTTPVSPQASGGYTIFAEIFDGMDAAFAISHAREARDIHGRSKGYPEANIRVERAILIDSCPEIYPYVLSQKITDAKPEVSLSLQPAIRYFPYGAPMQIRLTISNKTNAVIELPQAPELTTGLRAWRATTEIQPGPDGEVEKEVLVKIEPNPGLEKMPLPLAGLRLQPGEFAGIQVDCAEFYERFARGGEFEIAWQGCGVITEALDFVVIKTRFASIEIKGKGTINAVLFEKLAPKNVERFAELAREGFYNKRDFHFALDSPELSLIQTGSTDGTGMGVEKPAQPIPLEASGQKFKKGSIVMARTSDPDSAASQFFIIKKISPELAALWKREKRYTVIGEIIARGPQPTQVGDRRPAADPGAASGMEILEKLVKGDVIEKITIHEKSPTYKDKE